MEKEFYKLVRDKIPEKIESNNEIAITRVLDDEEFRQELYKKLLEECNEVINSTNSSELLEELADILEVLKTIASLENKSVADLIELAEQKRLKRGGFEKKIYLEKTMSKI